MLNHNETISPNTNKGINKMKVKDVFSDLAVARHPQKVELDIYADDAKALKDFVEYKKRKLGGEITTAEVFNRLLKVIWCDDEFVNFSKQASTSDAGISVPKLATKTTEKATTNS